MYEALRAVILSTLPTRSIPNVAVVHGIDARSAVSMNHQSEIKEYSNADSNQ
jgi:hypothetical protein